MSYGGYGKPDPYSDYMSGAGQGGAQAAASSFLPMALPAAGLGLNVIGTAIQGFGAYKQYQQVERQRKEEQRRYEEQVRRQQEQDRIAAIERKKRDEEMRLSQNMGYGGYARTMQDQRTAPYHGFASRIGL